MKDELVPANQTKRLYDAATGAKFKGLYQCSAGDHNMTWKIGGNEYIQWINEFFSRCEGAED